MVATTQCRRGRAARAARRAAKPGPQPHRAANPALRRAGARRRNTGSAPQPAGAPGAAALRRFRAPRVACGMSARHDATGAIGALRSVRAATLGEARAIGQRAGVARGPRAQAARRMRTRRPRGRRYPPAPPRTRPARMAVRRAAALGARARLEWLRLQDGAGGLVARVRHATVRAPGSARRPPVPRGPAKRGGRRARGHSSRKVRSRERSRGAATEPTRRRRGPRAPPAGRPEGGRRRAAEGAHFFAERRPRRRGPVATVRNVGTCDGDHQENLLWPL